MSALKKTPNAYEATTPGVNEHVKIPILIFGSMGMIAATMITP